MSKSFRAAGRLPPPDVRRWVAIGVFLALYTLLFTTLSRYFEWDEAVYFSQSGPWGRGVTEALFYSPSRELGTAWITAVMRVVAGNSLPLVRLGWIAVSTVLVVLAYRQIGKVGPRWSGEIAALVFGTFWITTGYMGSLFGSLLGALFLLLAAGFYLEVLDTDRPNLRAGALLGLALAGGFYMRTVETVLAVAVLLVHSVIARRAAIWRRQWRSLITALTAFVASFVLPWMIHSAVVYGSPLGHLTAWIERRQRSGSQERFPVALHNGAGHWFALLRGDSYLATTAFPRWPGIVIGLALLALLGAVGWALVRRWRTKTGVIDLSHLGLLTVLSVTSFGLFFFLVADDRDRYAFYGAVFAAAAAGQLLARGVAVLTRAAIDTRVLVAIGVAVALWIVANATLSLFYDRVRVEYAQGDRAAVALVRDTADGTDCTLFFTGLVRAPLAVGSVCDVQMSRKIERLPDLAERVVQSGRVAMVYWHAINGPWPGGPEWESAGRLPIRTLGRRDSASIYVQRP